ncbi:hypothetical protein P175DRAFT_0146622 [Aspergillus ochraceoroseus IBT 24754]|uniref:Secreted protein n=1 Tax=Aspergillus ochraceoroseus IBT 24754 TaxID=1392256 RepID=A0A2T5M2Q5_9EURO|nr:uncharacterized protein P175DRAFT_0146622 [Aspergillus ochraceoroseus IBT 24754]PTU22812.1 hypothetical protein P175DRAFT_0146622 [Aspergillus ochraceoroseus IBT 24754]
MLTTITLALAWGRFSLCIRSVYAESSGDGKVKKKKQSRLRLETTLALPPPPPLQLARRWSISCSGFWASIYCALFSLRSSYVYGSSDLFLLTLRSILSIFNFVFFASVALGSTIDHYLIVS